MEDQEIIDLLWKRKEAAIFELDKKYRSLCYKICWNILENHEDCEECVNDTWLSVWDSVPPQRPLSLSAFLSKITRAHAIDRYRRKNAKKRSDGVMCQLQDELVEVERAYEGIPEEKMEEQECLALIDQFLWEQSEQVRSVFLLRYWYGDSIQEISARLGLSLINVRTILHRTRKKLAAVLREEGRTI